MSDQQNQGKEAKKVIAAFEGNMRKLVAIMGGESKVKPTSKIPGDTMGDLVKELLKEDHEKLGKEIKEEVRALVAGKVAMDKAFKAKEEECQKLKIEKYKEFNQVAAKVFGKIDKIGTIEQEYYAALGQAVQGAAEAQTEELPEQEESDSSAEETT